MTYAAIDIGTCSCRLLIAEIIEDKLIPVYQGIETTRLGEQINTEIHSGGMGNTFRALGDFYQKIKEYNVSFYRVVATDAVRQSINRAEFINLAELKCRCKVEVISGEEEACLSYMGVERGLELKQSPLVVDLGGGSTEFIKKNGECFVVSLPVGAIKAMKMSTLEISKIISSMSKNKENFINNPLVFVGGTATTLVAIKKSLETYRSDLVHGEVLTRREIADIYNMLEMMPLNLRKRLPGLQPERADIIPKGALIVLLIMDYLGKKEITVSESDLLCGIIWEKYDQKI